MGGGGESRSGGGERGRAEVGLGVVVRAVVAQSHQVFCITRRYPPPSYYYICLLILLYMFPHATIYLASSCCCVCVRILVCVCD